MTDLVPISLAQALAAIQADLDAIHKAIERATITPAPEWVTKREAAAHFKRDVSTIDRWIRDGEIETNGKSKGMLRVKVER